MKRAAPAPPTKVLHPVTRYATEVLAGRIVVGRLVRLACERHLRDLKDGHKRGLRFDEGAANHGIEFYGFLRHSKGEWAGKVVELELWQMFVVGSVFGWLTKDGTRRFREAYEEVARKNGKSTKLAGTGLYLLVADGEPGAEVYAAATKKDQAKIVWTEAERMVRKSPAIGKRIKPYKTALVIEGTASKFEPLGSDEDTLDGLNIHGAIVDELHAHKSSGVVDVLETATGSRRQSLVWYITTAGYDKTSVCWRKRADAVNILEGVVQDDTVFAYIATIDEEDDWTDEAVWIKANPNLGVSVKLEDLRRKCEKAKRMPAAQNAFRRLHLNQWTEQADRWLDVEVWDSCKGDFTEAEMGGRAVFLSLDLSATGDLASEAKLFPPIEAGEKVRVVWRFWLPKEGLRDREIRDKAPYAQWAREGWLTLTEGNVIDYDVVRRDVNDDGDSYEVKELAVDPWNATQVSTQLMGDGFTVINVRQGFATLSAPTKELSRLLLERGLEHDGNPIARYQAAHVAVKQDPAGNLKPDKAQSTKRIDGIVALVMALSRFMVAPDTVSVYETDELLLL